MTTLVAGAVGKHGGVANLTVVALRKTGPDRDFYFIEPYQDAPSPASSELQFSTNLQLVDVAILLDTTGSMNASIGNLQRNLTTGGGIFDGLTDAVPNVGLAVVDHRDFPYELGTDDYGSPGDYPVRVRQTITTDPLLAQKAVNTYTRGAGDDDPESQIPARWIDYVLTGNALTWPASTLEPGSVPAHVNAPGTAGGVDFRPGAFRVVVQITDAPWHNYDGSPADPLATPYAFPAPDFHQLVADFKAANAKYVGIVDDHSVDTHPHMESQALSDATDSNVPASVFPGGVCNAQAGKAPNGNCRLNFDIDDGTGLDTSFVQAIQAISLGTTFNVTAVAANDPSNPGGVDATQFISAIRCTVRRRPRQRLSCPTHHQEQPQRALRQRISRRHHRNAGVLRGHARDQHHRSAARERAVLQGVPQRAGSALGRAPQPAHGPLPRPPRRPQADAVAGKVKERRGSRRCAGTMC